MNKDNFVINDPVYGFINLPSGLLSCIVDHPWFQRLGRIRQLGMASIVYPGAQHTRKQHSLGAYHLMCEALRNLQEKGHSVSEEELEATKAVILLHDIGHGPYSHVLENEFVEGLSHEEMSLVMMNKMNAEWEGALSLAMEIFKGSYPKSFLHELICSQLDMDRLDYLCRDSFYTGVIEGNIGASRIIKMLDVAGGKLVVCNKGIYSVENYLMARRLMYWQVYLHKTVVGAEQLLRSALRRAKYLSNNGVHLFATPSLQYFICNEFTIDDLYKDPAVLQNYVNLDDSDIIVSLKDWMHSSDKVLSLLATAFIHRNLLKCRIYDREIPKGLIEDFRMRTARVLGISYADTDYFVSAKSIGKEMYVVSSSGIGMLNSDGTVKDISEVSSIVRKDNRELNNSKLYVFAPSIVYDIT